ncbi:MAG: SPOR domain-containing protein [Bacteroidota bacterium]|jgi:hypothetical protein
MKKNMVSSIAFLVSALFFAEGVSASDTIVVVKDPRLDILSQKQALINKRTSVLTSNGKIKGFRIQITSTSSRDQAFNAKAAVQSKFPDQKVYTTYQAPLFKVRVGDFLKREDAEKYRKLMLTIFPTGMYVVEDVVDAVLEDTYQ